MRFRITVKGTGQRGDDLRLAADVRRDLYAHAPFEADPEQPLHGIHRDVHGRAYFEFATRSRDQVDQLLQEFGHAQLVELTEPGEAIGEACQNCSNVAGPELPTVCPNCGFRDYFALPLMPSRNPTFPLSTYQRKHDLSVPELPSARSPALQRHDVFG